MSAGDVKPLARIAHRHVHNPNLEIYGRFFPKTDDGSRPANLFSASDENKKGRTLAYGSSSQALDEHLSVCDDLEVHSPRLSSGGYLEKWLGIDKGDLEKRPNIDMEDPKKRLDINKKDLEKWRDHGKNMLWISGTPGAGKSNLTSLMLDEVLFQSRNSFPYQLSYFYLANDYCLTSSSNWQRNILTHFSAATHGDAWSFHEEPHYGLINHTPDHDSTHQHCMELSSAPTNIEHSRHPKIMPIHHLDDPPEQLHDPGAPQILNSVDYISGKLLRCIRAVVWGGMPKTPMLLSPLCFATRVSAVSDNGSCENIINQSTNIGLKPYTESLQDTQNFLISVESPPSDFKSPKSNLI